VHAWRTGVAEVRLFFVVYSISTRFFGLIILAFRVIGGVLVNHFFPSAVPPRCVKRTRWQRPRPPFPAFPFPLPPSLSISTRVKYIILACWGCLVRMVLHVRCFRTVAQSRFHDVRNEAAVDFLYDSGPPGGNLSRALGKYRASLSLG